MPIDLVDSASKQIRLRCALSEFEALEDAVETQYLSGAGGRWSYRHDQMLSQPYYGLGMGGVSMGGVGYGSMSVGPQVVHYDRVPLGEVEVRRGEHVHATDGNIGSKDWSSIPAIIM
ncbi:MAG: hypothetical protein ACYCV7_17815 [Acidimicrobiales bacterium]